MCGFFAIVNRNRNELRVNDMLKAMRNRGPDDHGWLSFEKGVAIRGRDERDLNGEIVLGHVRLAIIDLTEAGWQPMSTKDGAYHIVFNGEIYNYLELRADLQREGYRFETSSDTEVLLTALVAWGTSALARLRGMFAFCLFDSRKRKLLLARDFFGIKPLFYAQVGETLAFASEQGVLLQVPGVTKDIEAQALYDYLAMGTTDQGTTTLLRDIHQFPAAHFALVDIDRPEPITLQRYWRVSIDRTVADTFSVAANRVRELFLESIDMHLRSDVPVGAALSGGIDSSAIVCAIRYLHPKQEIHSFSYIADEERISEERWVDLINEHTGAVAHKVRARKEEMLEDLEDLIQAQGEPFGSTSIYAQYRVFKSAAAAGIKVMLDGQGADEMLAGYVFYQGSRLASLVRSSSYRDALSFFLAASSGPGRSRKQIAMYSARELLPQWALPLARRLASREVPPRWVSADWIENVGIQVRPESRTSKTFDVLRSHLLETLEVTSIPHLLRYEDRNSMRFSIESRVPFLHVELAEYLFSLPEHYLISPDGTTKHVFREAMRGIVPDPVLDRKDKIGFATPERTWLVKLDHWVKERLSRASELQCFNSEELHTEWERVVSGQADFNFRCWRWLNAIEWNDMLAGRRND